MNGTQERIVFLRRAAILCGVLVLVITSLSAFIRLSAAGLGCDDWPRCYGQALREAQRSLPASAVESRAGATARLVHRVVAVAVLLLVLAMVSTCLATTPRLPAQGVAALALLALALFLAVLGIWTAGARVPAVAMGNLLGGFAMLAICARMTVSTKPLKQPHPAVSARTTLARVAIAVLACQITLGALVSAGYAGLSCPNLMSCDFAGTTDLLASLNPLREPWFDATTPVNPAGAPAHVVHRIGAFVTLVVLATLGVAAIRSGRHTDGLLLLALLAVQVTLGVLLVVLALPLPLALAHNVVAALMLAVVLRLA